MLRLVATVRYLNGSNHDEINQADGKLLNQPAMYLGIEPAQDKKTNLTLI